MSNHPEIIWEEPPPPKNNANKYDWFYEGIKNEKPGEWARFPGSDSAAKNKSDKDYRYESTVRTIDGERVTFMRYDPDAEAPEPELSGTDPEEAPEPNPEDIGDPDIVGDPDLDPEVGTDEPIALEDYEPDEEDGEITTTTPSFPG